MIEHLYRFRPLRRLIEGGELRNQEIYFAKTDQLNDPMEGFRDVFWRGDAIVWRNFLRHYVVCLDTAFGQWMLCGEAEPLEWAHIPVFNYGNLNDDIPHKAFEKELLANFFAEPCIQRLVDALAIQPLPIRRDELSAHLSAVHLLALSLIREAYARRGMHPDIPKGEELTASARKTVDLAVDSIDKFRELAEQNPVNELQIDAYYASRQRTVSQLNLINFYNTKMDFQQSNRNFVALTFPDEFVKQVEMLVYPEWYAACFMRNCRNSAIWGSYGENHEAVCLKFRVSDGNSRPNLLLRRQSGFNADGPIIDFRKHPFKEITYDSEHVPVDFFRSLGRFPIPVLRQYWYSDENGNRSPYGEEIFRADDAWRKRYWAAFYHAITRKLKDWSTEEEYRLILDNYFLDFRDPAMRKLTYHFCDLSGVIFGIKTPMEAKLTICKIIEEKCRKENRTDFKFYQAFYSRVTGTIEHAEISLLKYEM